MKKQNKRPGGICAGLRARAARRRDAIRSAADRNHPEANLDSQGRLHYVAPGELQRQIYGGGGYGW